MDEWLKAALGDGQATGTVDVAVNIFAKPYQTSLSLLSLLKASGQHIGTVWLQYEPVGSKFDSLTPYCIAYYLQEQLGERCRVFQPTFWLAREIPDASRFTDTGYRMGIRYQYAFEHSQSPRFFLMHNDVFIQKDIVGAMLAALGDAFAIGRLGQCWNCPASHAGLTRSVLGREPCSPGSYEAFRLDYDALCALYAAAHAQGIFCRPYDEGFSEHFRAQPWPLPECRINEWACLVNLEKVRPLCIPQGSAIMPGAFQHCGAERLDTGVAWFRDMHAHGLHARHLGVENYMQHWVGTGHKSSLRYRQAEKNACRLLQKFFPDYVQWLSVHRDAVAQNTFAGTAG